ncbi:MAG: transposase, partial [Pseudomonadota bacterium]
MWPCIFVFAMALPMIGRAIIRPGVFGSAGAPISGVLRMGASGISQVPRRSILRLCGGPRPRTTPPASPVTAGRVLPPDHTHRRRHHEHDIGASPAALSPAVYASRPPLPTAMQDSLPAGGLRLCRAGIEPAGSLRTVSGHSSPPFCSRPPFRGLLDASMAHVRRKFVDTFQSQGSQIAEEAIRRIALLYAVEKAARGKSPDERVALRLRDAKLVFDDLEIWLVAQLNRISGKSELAKAIRYALGRMKKMRGYLTNGSLEIDNNSAGRSIRCVALGRKNFLFVGSKGG